MKNSTLILIQFILSAVVGATIACSPTKFDVGNNDLCSSPSDACVVEGGYTNVTQTFKVGAGKVDILFIDDNSASMYPIQTRLAARFAGFVEALDRKEIDYQIAITTTDLNFAKSSGLITFGHGSKVLKSTDSNRVSLFNGAIVRTETRACEQYILSQYHTYGPTFNERAGYAQGYAANCPSGDERGIYSAYEVLSKNVGSIVRQDANLNIIALTNEDVRSGLYNQNPAFALENNDKATTLANMINGTYSGKYWEFNSIITKDAACVSQQQQEFPYRDGNGNYVFGSNIGMEYAALSASASTTVDGLAAPRGQILSICNSDYTAYFANIAAKISDAARLLTLKCAPNEAPTVTNSNGQPTTVPYTWNGSNKIIFHPGSEGVPVQVAYKCYTGVK